MLQGYVLRLCTTTSLQLQAASCPFPIPLPRTLQLVSAIIMQLCQRHMLFWFFCTQDQVQWLCTLGQGGSYAHVHPLTPQCSSHRGSPVHVPLVNVLCITLLQAACYCAITHMQSPTCTCDIVGCRMRWLLHSLLCPSWVAGWWWWRGCSPGRQRASEQQ